MSVLSGPLVQLWFRLGPRPYNAMYRRGAPWEGTPRAELVALLDSGRLTARGRTRALDLGCGSGADSRLMAEHGFDVTGVDFSEVAIEKARTAGGGVQYVQADLLDLPAEVTDQRFDVIFDGGTIDDFPPDKWPRLAGTVTALAKPGAVFIMWCFSVRPEDAPLFSLSGPSRVGGLGILPEDVHDLFGADWRIDSVPTADPAERAACYWMTRRGSIPAQEVADDHEFRG